MWRFVIRRVWQMIPTVFGVILITFILFNIVGGSPATMVFKKMANPKMLEDFDEVRGFNKPLFFGWWVSTRALATETFTQHAGAWRECGEFVPQAGVRLTNTVTVPLAFPLQATNSYRLTLTYRMADEGAGAVFQALESHPLAFSKPWKTVELDFRTGERPSTTDLVVRVSGGALELRAVRLQRGMERPYDSQLWFYLRQLAHLDFGTSISLNQPVSQLLKDGIGPSLVLMIPILIGEELFAIVLALGCAFYRNTLLDRTLVVLSVALMSINYLAWIVGGQYVLGQKLGWFPVWGFESWRYLVLPVVIGIISGIGGNLRFYRTIMLDEMYKDYIRTAIAKGVSKSGVLFKHVLKNAMIPVATNVVIALPFLYTGNFLLENFFGIPGLGYLGINAINSSDVDVVRALVFIGAVLFVVANLVTDLLYAWLDPRVRLE